jgi:hypothetical protein
MNRNLYLVLGAGALIALAACTVKSETTGTGGTGGTTTHSTTNTGGTGNTGGGGGAACISCADWLASCATACADPNEICDASATAYMDLFTCACTTCATDCTAEECPDIGTGSGGSGSEACQTCQTDAITGAACSTELAACSAN